MISFAPAGLEGFRARSVRITAAAGLREVDGRRAREDVRAGEVDVHAVEAAHTEGVRPGDRDTAEVEAVVDARQRAPLSTMIVELAPTEMLCPSPPSATPLLALGMLNWNVPPLRKTLLPALTGPSALLTVRLSTPLSM